MPKRKATSKPTLNLRTSFRDKIENYTSWIKCPGTLCRCEWMEWCCVLEGLSFNGLKEDVDYFITVLVNRLLLYLHRILKTILCLKCRHRLKQDIADQAIPRRRQHMVIANINLSRRIAVRPAERVCRNEEQINQRHPYFSHRLKDVTNILQTHELIVEIIF